MKKFTIFLLMIFVISNIFVSPVFAGTDEMELGEQKELNNDSQPGGNSSSGNSNSNSGKNNSGGKKNGGNNGGSGDDTERVTKSVTQVLSTTTYTGDYGRKTYLYDNYYLWTFRNKTTGNTTNDKGGYKYTWKPQEVGEYYITSEVNCQYQYWHRKYTVVKKASYTVSYIPGIIAAGADYQISNYREYTTTTHEKINDEVKAEYDSSRTRKWNFTVCYPPTTIEFPSDRQEEIPVKHNLVL
jgi:hypothetical protein